jgi:hypothetical protein
VSVTRNSRVGLEREAEEKNFKKDELLILSLGVSG